MANNKNKTKFICSNCGKIEAKWIGKCPNCGSFGTFEEREDEVSRPTNISSINVVSNKKAEVLSKIRENKDERIITGISEFDRVVGGGIVSDSITILTAPPGAGKSTLCIDICDKIASTGRKVLYASGEESSSQIKSRAIRLGIKNLDSIYILDDSNMDLVINEIKDKEIDFFILDSINSYYLNNLLPSRANNPTQVLGCAEIVRDTCKNNSRPVACVMIGQMTKDDELAGSRSLEHLVDTYLRLEGEREDSLRFLVPVKNRFGSTEEIGFFNMEESGLECIENPSEFFMTERNYPIVGSSLCVLKEGSRPIVAEVESLISHCFTPYPSRIGDSLRKDQLNTLISILEQRAKINLFDKNVVIKTAGNLKLNDPSSNLAILMSISSSFYRKEIPLKNVFISDVGLTGELKKVPNIEQRIKELDRMGYEKVYIAKGALKNVPKLSSLEVIECKFLYEVLDKVFADRKEDK